MRVLLAIDGSACSDAAVDEVASRPWPAGSEFRVLTAYEPPMMLTPEAWATLPDSYELVERVARDQARVTSALACRKLSRAFGENSKVTSEIESGSAKVVILEHAEKWEADLIVVGSHGYRTWQRLLLGSVSQGIVLHAQCSVEVVRCKGARAKVREAA